MKYFLKPTIVLPALLLVAALLLSGCTQQRAEAHPPQDKLPQSELNKLHKAYFASGCFWCVESIFESVRGVKEAVSGYSGGSANTANYSQVSRGATRHAEAVEVYYDSSEADYPTLLTVFFGSHDPTTLNRQGPDRGPQYRSAVFYKNKQEHDLTWAAINQINNSGQYKDRLVTEVRPLDVFYPAEDYHQDFEHKNPNHRYVQAISVPRLKKFQQKYPSLLKSAVPH